MLVLKHLSDWAFDECEREVRGSLVYRAFCRIDGERVPDAKTLIRLARLLDEPVLKDVLARLVALGRERHVVRGRRLRVDTTVVETNIHYPTDAFEASGRSRDPAGRGGLEMRGPERGGRHAAARGLGVGPSLRTHSIRAARVPSRMASRTRRGEYASPITLRSATLPLEVRMDSERAPEQIGGFAERAERQTAE